MHKQLFFLRQNKYYFLISGLAVLLNISSWILTFLFLSERNFNIILHYNILFGVDYQGSPNELFTIPLVGALILLLNLVIVKFVYQKEKFISYLLLSTSLVSQIFVIIAIATIILVNSKSLY